jgi:hypothetical protein
METTETVVPEHYNPNQLVTYKIINGDETTYPTSKVTDIEWKLENYRYVDKRLSEYSSKVNQLEESLSVWLENANDAETIVSEICSIFGFNPTKEIEFEANVTITGTVTVPLAELADFDIESVDLNVDANSWSHDIEIYSTEVDSISTA